MPTWNSEPAFRNSAGTRKLVTFGGRLIVKRLLGIGRFVLDLEHELLDAGRRGPADDQRLPGRHLGIFGRVKNGHCRRQVVRQRQDGPEPLARRRDAGSTYLPSG